MATVRRTTTTILLAVLAVAAFAAAAITLTNVTEWHIYAKNPPIVKVKGADAVSPLVNVTTTTGSDGTNRTVIYLTGFTGDPTHYDEVIKICNKNTSKTYNVQLVYKQVLSGDWTYVQYVKLWLGSSGPLFITSSGATGSAATSVGPGQCVSVPAEVLVKPNAPTGTELIAIEVDVVSTG